MKSHSKQILSICAAMLFSISAPLSVSAHPGRLDANGGHWNRSTGTYHYHNRSGSSSSSLSSGNASSSYNYNGWRSVGGKWRYYSNSAMKTGWIKDKNCWYFCESNGDMATGWKKVSDKWYYFNNSGSMVTGWKSINGAWYYFDASGAMKTGWQLIDSTWYYFQSSGAMVSNGWYWINGLSYYFYPSGAMAQNTTIDGYQVDASGAWVGSKLNSDNILTEDILTTILDELTSLTDSYSTFIEDTFTPYINGEVASVEGIIRDKLTYFKNEKNLLTQKVEEWKKYNELSFICEHTNNIINLLDEQVRSSNAFLSSTEYDDKMDALSAIYNEMIDILEEAQLIADDLMLMTLAYNS